MVINYDKQKMLIRLRCNGTNQKQRHRTKKTNRTRNRLQKKRIQNPTRNRFQRTQTHKRKNETSIHQQTTTPTKREYRITQKQSQHRK